jgi:hypothetical protein
MRPLLASLAFLAAAAAGAAELRFVRVWPEWHDGDSFQSYYEYRTGNELVSKRWTVLRSQPDDRSGLYFLVRVENPGEMVRGATFVVRVISPESIDTHVYSFPADVPKGSRLFEIGLTGKDWVGARVDPVAWDVELQSGDGKVLYKKVSFLWEKPGR